VIEGVDRSGKDTQIDMLIDAIPNSMRYSFPNEQLESGKRCRSYVNGELKLGLEESHLLFVLNRRESIPQIDSYLNEGKNVICSRYSYSGIAYSVAKGLDYQWCKDQEKDILEPDLVIYLDVDPSIASGRNGYGVDTHEVLSFQRQVYESYARLWNDLRINLLSIDGHQSMIDIHDQILRATQL